MSELGGVGASGGETDTDTFKSTAAEVTEHASGDDGWEASGDSSQVYLGGGAAPTEWTSTSSSDLQEDWGETADEVTASAVPTESGADVGEDWGADGTPATPEHSADLPEDWGDAANEVTKPAETQEYDGDLPSDWDIAAGEITMPPEPQPVRPEDGPAGGSDDGPQPPEGTGDSARNNIIEHRTETNWPPESQSMADQQGWALDEHARLNRMEPAAEPISQSPQETSIPAGDLAANPTVANEAPTELAQSDEAATPGTDQLTAELATLGNADAQTIVNSGDSGKLTNEVLEKAGVQDTVNAVAPNLSDAIRPIDTNTQESAEYGISENARRVEAAVADAARETTATHKALAERAANESRALEEKAQAERATLEVKDAEDKALAEKAANEPKALEEKAQAERATLEVKDAEDKALAEKAANESKALEEKAQAERATLEVKDAEDKALAEKAANEPKALEEKAQAEWATLEVKDAEDKALAEKAANESKGLEEKAQAERAALEVKDAEDKALAEKAANESKGLEEKAQAERAALEVRDAEDKALAERAANESKALEEKAQAERATLEVKDAEDKARAEKAANESKALEEKAQAERATLEVKDAEDKALAERAANESKALEEKAQAERATLEVKDAEDKALAEKAANESKALEENRYVRTQFANTAEETTGIYERGYQQARDDRHDTVYVDASGTKITQFQRDTPDKSPRDDGALRSRYVTPDQSASELSAEQAQNGYALFYKPDAALEGTFTGTARQSVVMSNTEGNGGGVQWEVVEGKLTHTSKKKL